jgi:hypothetical protein
MQNTEHALNTFECPVCNSIFRVIETDQDIRISYKRNSDYPRSRRYQMMMNLIYLRVGALLALAGVALPGCTDTSLCTCDTEGDSATGEPLDSDTETKEGTAAGYKQKSDTGSGDTEGDSATGGQSDTGTNGHLEGDTETDTASFNAITDDCEAMRQFFTDCYWTEDQFSGPTYQQINQECSYGNTISESLAHWHACWQLPENGCDCPTGAAVDVFECQSNKCQQWISCITECRL